MIQLPRCTFPLLLGLLCASQALPAAAQQRRIGGPIAINQTQGLTALKLRPGVTLAEIHALPPEALVETRSGRKVTAAEFGRTSEALKAIGQQAPKLRAMDLNLSRGTGPAQMQWQGPQQLQTLRTLPPGVVIQLKDGKTLTASDIDKLQQLSLRTGLADKLAARAAQRAQAVQAQRRAATPALVIRSAADVQRLKTLPDDALVQGPNGARATAGEIRAVAAERRAAQGLRSGNAGRDLQIERPRVR
jgi:CheY-like chemotaxis protein